jgi:hypothetical protein
VKALKTASMAQLFANRHDFELFLAATEWLSSVSFLTTPKSPDVGTRYLLDVMTATL